MFENVPSVSMKSRRRFLHLSSFSDSNSFMTAGPGLDLPLLTTLRKIGCPARFFAIRLSTDF